VNCGWWLCRTETFVEFSGPTTVWRSRRLSAGRQMCHYFLQEKTQRTISGFIPWVKVH
jgi:hypothetical protein